MSSGLFIFRRDLRLNDNTALLAALNENDIVYLIFIFDPRQVKNNPYKSNNCVNFMINSLIYLNKKVHIDYFYGRPEKILKSILEQKQIDCVYINMDYSDFALSRDTALNHVCRSLGVRFSYHHDVLLLKHGVPTEATENLKVYKKFTPFYEYYKKSRIDEPKHITNTMMKKFRPLRIKAFKFTDSKYFYDRNPNLIGKLKGGRDEGIKILSDMPKRSTFLSDDSSGLSAYLKFGCLSIREVYHLNKGLSKSDLVNFRRQLFWREFYYQVYPYYKNTVKSNKKIGSSAIKWERSTIGQKNLFLRWSKGTTGYPLVDAGMREMLSTGFMHNRARLNVADFLVKKLNWYWKEGEQFFARHLLDYDIIQNNGNWQWVAGTGTDSQPYYRHFSPTLQLKKYDPECIYVRKWVPELRKVPVKDILNWEKKHAEYKGIYYKPLLL